MFLKHSFLTAQRCVVVLLLLVSSLNFLVPADGGREQTCPATPDVLLFGTEEHASIAGDGMIDSVARGPVPRSQSAKCSDLVDRRAGDKLFTITVRLQDENCNKLSVDESLILMQAALVRYRSSSASKGEKLGSPDQVICSETLTSGANGIPRVPAISLSWRSIQHWSTAVATGDVDIDKESVQLLLTLSALRSSSGNFSRLLSTIVLPPWAASLTNDNVALQLPAVKCLSTDLVSDVEGPQCQVNVTLSHDQAKLASASLPPPPPPAGGNVAGKPPPPSCSPQCMGDNQCECVDNGVCSCSAGYTGALCEIPVTEQHDCIDSPRRVTPATPAGADYPKSIPLHASMCSGDPAYRSAVQLQLSIQLIHGPSCRAVHSERVDIWQADSRGEYCPSCSATVRSDVDGRLTLNSVQPAGSKGRPRVMHILVHNTTAAMSPCGQRHSPLTTQLYFMGDPMRARGLDKCGAQCRADDPRLSMMCVHLGDLQHLHCKFTVVLDSDAAATRSGHC
eukprot:scpid75953/ scgid8439/ 